MKILPLIACLALTACAVPAVKQVPTTAPAAITAPTPAAKFSKTDYAKIKTGMTYQEMVRAVGREPKEVSQSETEFMGNQIRTVIYSYSNPDFSNAVITVQNGVVKSKSASRLP